MKKNRYLPDWKYELPEKLLSRMDEYHILKVPLLGQHYPGGPEDWCGRTSCTMAYNYYQMVQGEADFESRMITHWDGGKPGWFVDLRFPNGLRAFHTKPDAEPHHCNLDGYLISNPAYNKGDVAVVKPPSIDDALPDFSASAILGFSRGVVLPYNEPGRKALAIQIANDSGQIDSRLETIRRAVTSNNPVVFYSGFSLNNQSPIHLILIIGYAYIVDDTGRHLWLAVADPATNERKCNSRKGAGMFFPPTEGSTTDEEAVAAGKLTHEHDIIRAIQGKWEQAQAAIILIRARKLFEPNPFSPVDDLYMDYWKDNSKGGSFIYSHKPTQVPPEMVYSNVMRSVAFPHDGQKVRFRPVNGYVMAEQSESGLFPLGGHRTLHSGIHLDRARFPERPPPPPAPPPPAPAPEVPEETKSAKGKKSARKKEEKPPPPPAPPTNQREVRCLAPGYIVALRLAHALPAPDASAAASEGQKKNTLAQELVGTHNSFILVRHDVEEMPRPGAAASGGGTPRRFTFYSLYMHLMPPDWTDAHTYREVSWLKRLARRDGSLVVLEPSHTDFGRVRWLQPASPGHASGPDDIVLKSGGTFSVIGAGIGLPEPLDLGEDTEGVAAVWRKPDLDVTELHEALIAGKVVTLAHPYLQVRAGEVLGYLDDKSRATGDGFLHWEVLAPSTNSSLEALLKFAEDKLALAQGGKPFFHFLEEKDHNNFFEPPEKTGGGTPVLDEVLALAPRSKHAGGPEQADLKSFRDTYSQETLQHILTSYTTLPFSAEEPNASGRAVPDEPSYPVDLLITNFKNALPPGAYELKLTFEPPSRELFVPYDGKQTQLRIRLPANARKIFVEPADASRLLLQTGSGGGKDALARDAAHFKNVASMRWRNVVLRHLNAWLPQGITQQVLAQLHFYEQLQIGETLVKDGDTSDEAKKAIEKLSTVVGWWAHEETAVLEAADQEKPLFAAQPDAQQLPKDTLLDNPHPVTFAWLMMLLTSHGLVRFVEREPWISEEAKALAAIGWVPARTTYEPLRVGEHIYLGALQRGEAIESVTARVKHGSRTHELRLGKAREGLALLPVELPGWGDWTLEAGGAKALGGLTLKGLKPVPLSEQEPTGLTSQKDGTFTWRIAFHAHCPRLIRGWILLKVARADEPKEVPGKAGKKKPGAEVPAAQPVLDFQDATLAIPVEGRESAALSEAQSVRFVDGYLPLVARKDMSVQVTRHFTYKAFLDAAAKGASGTGPLLARELADAVERIQCLYGPHQALTLTELSADGLSLGVHAPHPVGLHDVIAQAKKDGWILDAEELGQGGVRIRVKAPDVSEHPGEVEFEFDANEVFSALRKTLPDGKRLIVRFGCLLPNGGELHDPRLARTETLGKRADAVDARTLRDKAGGDFLELWSDVEAEVLHHQPSFGTPEYRLTDKGLSISVPLLGGSEDFWKAAAPIIKLGQDKLDEKATGKVQGARLLRSVEFGAEGMKDVILAIQAVAQKKRVPLRTERIDIEPSSKLMYDTTRGAELTLTPGVVDPFKLQVRLATTGVGSGKGFKFEVYAVGADGQTGARALTLTKNTLALKSKLNKQGFAVTDAEGLLQAEVNLRDVAVALKEGQSFLLRAVPEAKKDQELLSEARGTLPAPIQTPPSSDSEEPFAGRWLNEDGYVPMKGERGAHP